MKTTLKEKIKNFIKSVDTDKVIAILLLIILFIPAIVTNPEILIYFAIAIICMYISKHL